MVHFLSLKTINPRQKVWLFFYLLCQKSTKWNDFNCSGEATGKGLGVELWTPNSAQMRSYGTRLSDPGEMQGWVDLIGLLHTGMVHPPKDGHPSCYPLPIGPLASRPATREICANLMIIFGTFTPVPITQSSTSAKLLISVYQRESADTHESRWSFWKLSFDLDRRTLAYRPLKLVHWPSHGIE